MHNGVLAQPQEENNVICSSTDGPREYLNAKGSKSERDKMPCDSPYLESEMQRELVCETEMGSGGQTVSDVAAVPMPFHNR